MMPTPTKKVKFKDRQKMDRLDIFTQNRFAALAADDQTKKKSTKIPQLAPITITDKTAKIDDIINSLQITHKKKVSSIGKKIFVESAEDKKKFITTLTDQKIEFFTHPDTDDKIFKVVLKGLPEIDQDELSESLKTENNLQPVKIIMMGKSTHKLYLLHFKKADVSLQDLRSIRVVYHHHIIRWMPYKPKKRGPTQCWKCLMFGHGQKHCNRAETCMFCGESHKSTVCPLGNNDSNQQSTQHVYKCFNCAKQNLPSNHMANDVACPSREQYITIRANARSHHKSQHKQLNPNPVTLSQQPAAYQRRNTNTATPAVSSSKFPVIQNNFLRKKSYATDRLDQTPSTSKQFGRSYADTAKTTSENN